MRFVMLVLFLGACTGEVTTSGREGDADEAGDSAPNQPPVADAASFTMLRNQTLPGQLTGTDADGDTLSFSLATGASSGTAVVNTDGSFTYAPSFDFIGTDRFDFRVSDGNAASEPATVTITVQLEPGAPTASAQLVTLDEDSTASVTLTGIDPDGDALTAALVQQPQHGGLSGTAPSFTYTPDLNYHGADSFTFTVTDGTHTSPAATVGITVRPIQDLPSAVAQSLGTAEDVQLMITLSGVDPDPESLLFDIDPVPLHGTLGPVTIASSRTATVLYTPDVNFHGVDSFGFVVDDGLATDEATVDLTITSVPDVPVANAVTFELTEDQSAETLTLTGQDGDGDVVSFEILTQPSHGTLGAPIPAGPGAIEVDYTPDDDFFGTDSFTFRVSGGGDDSPAATVTLDVAGVNDPPSAFDDGTLTTVANTLLEAVPAHALTPFDGLIDNDSDPDGDALTVELPLSTLQGGTLTVVDASVGSFTYLPPAGYTGPDGFTYMVTDGTDSDTAGVTLSVVGPVIWYVDSASAAVNHTGRSTEPFATLASAAAVSMAGQIVYVDTGAFPYGGGYALQPNQQLVGRGAALVLAPNVDLAPGVRPTITGPSTVITASNGTAVRGVNLSGGSYGIQGNSITGLTVASVGIVNPGSMGVWLNSASGALSFSDLDISMVSGDLMLIYGNTPPDVTLNDVQLSTANGNGITAFDLASLHIDSALPLDERPSTLSATGGSCLVLARVADADVSFAELTSDASSGNGVYLEDVDGLVRFPDATVSDAAYTGVTIAGGALDVEYVGSVTGAGTNVLVVGEVDGSVSFTGGVLSGPNGALAVQNVTGPVTLETIALGVEGAPGLYGTSFVNDADVTIGSFEVYTDNGGLYANNVDHLLIYGGLIESTDSSAVMVFDADVDVTLERVISDSTTTSIWFDNSTGDFAVTGDLADTPDSGGYLTGDTPSDKVLVEGLDSFTLRHLTVDGIGQRGIGLSGVGSATLEDVHVLAATREALQMDNAGDLALRDSELVSLGENSWNYALDYDGTASSFVIERTLIDNAPTRQGLNMRQHGGIATVVLNDVTADDPIGINLDTAATMNFVLEDSHLTNTALMFYLSNSGGAPTLDAEVTRTTFLGGIANTPALNGYAEAGSTMGFDIHDNGQGSPGGFVDVVARAISLFTVNATLYAKITNNLIDGDGTYLYGNDFMTSGAGPAASRIAMSQNLITGFTNRAVSMNAEVSGTTHFIFSGNTIGTLAAHPSGDAVHFQTVGGNPSIIAAFTANTIYSDSRAVASDSFDSGGFDLVATGNTFVGSNLDVSADAAAAHVCLDLNAANTSPNSSAGGYVLWQAAGSYQLAGYTGSVLDPVAVQTYVESRNSGPASALITSGIMGVVSCAVALPPP